MNEQRNWYGHIIAWFAHNPVAANLLMFCLIAGGIYSTITISKEITPRIETNYVTVTVPYRGGTPRDVEQGVLIKVEEAIQDLDGVREIVATAREGAGTVRVEVDADYDVLEVLDTIKSRVDAIPTFPAETERPRYQRATWSQNVIWVSVFGSVPERTLKEAARQMRDEITALPSITRAELTGARPYEIGIEVREETLREYNLTLGEVAQAIRRSSLDLPSGRIQASGGDILVRTVGQAYVGADFEDIVVRTNDDGSRVMVGDVAEIDDGFVEGDFYSRHNGEPAIAIRILSVGDQDALAVAREVREYIDRTKATLPEGISIDYWADISYLLRKYCGGHAAGLSDSGFVSARQASVLGHGGSAGRVSGRDVGFADSRRDDQHDQPIRLSTGSWNRRGRRHRNGGVRLYGNPGEGPLRRQRGQRRL